MRKSIMTGVILSMFLILAVTPSSAILIEFDPVSQTVPVGNPSEVALVISGLGDLTAPSVSEFDVDIGFDETILAFNSVAFGDPVLGDQLDLFGFGSFTSFDDSLPGIVNLFQLSFDLEDDLNDFQVDSFTLATLTFDTLAYGTSSLDIFINSLGDANGDPLDAQVASGSISPVPEPATILLLASGMAGLGVFGRKRFKR